MRKSNAAYRIAKSQHEAAQTQVKAQRHSGAQTREAVAKLSEARAARELAAAKLAQTQLRASATSTVLTRQVEPGDIVQPGKTLLTLATVGETRITAQIDEKNLPYLKVGETALASADAFPDAKFSAELYYLAPSVDAERGTVEARFRIPDPPTHLRADMTLTVEVRAAHKEHAFVVPFEAVRGTTSGTPTLLTVQDGKAVSQPVAIGLQAGGNVEILRGVQAGEHVVINATITPGTRVRPRVIRDARSEVVIMMKFERTLALRFLREGRMQTALIIGGTSIGVSLIIFITGVLTGVQADLVTRTLGTQPHIVVRPPDEVNHPQFQEGYQPGHVRHCAGAGATAPLYRSMAISGC